MLPCTTMIGEEDLVVEFTIPLLGTSKQFEMFKIHNHQVPNRRTNQSNLLVRYNIDTEAMAIEDVRSTFTTLDKIDVNFCLQQHGNFCSITKNFYSVSSSKLCKVKILQYDAPEIEKLCSISVENNLVDRDAVNLGEKNG